VVSIALNFNYASVNGLAWK